VDVFLYECVSASVWMGELQCKIDTLNREIDQVRLCLYEIKSVGVEIHRVALRA
jgi:hypothetical protein